MTSADQDLGPHPGTGQRADDTPSGLGHQLGFQALELWALSAFAVAQPLLSLLGERATFFTAHRVSGAGIIWFALVLLFVVPLPLIGLEAAVAIGSRAASARLHDALVGALVAATLGPPIARAVGLGPAAWVVLMVLLAVGAAVAVNRLRVVRTLVRALAIAPLLFLFTFAVLSPASALIGGELPTPAHAADRPSEAAPVVWLVLDQFPMSLVIDEQGEIVAERLPNLARLASTSTWYPNAIAGVSQTTMAVPAALTGHWPEWGQLPVASQQPVNLFTILGTPQQTETDERNVWVEEYVTQLCPDSICQQASRVDSTWSDTAAVYVRYLLPERVADRFVPRIDNRWDGFGDGRLTADEATTGKELRDRRRAADENRVRFDRFLERLRTPDLDGVHYAHLLLPHEPLHYLPDGRIAPLGFQVHPDDEGRWPDDEATMQARLQRYIAQTMFADHLVGQLLDTLEEAGTLDETLVVVMSDHGASTRPGMLNKSIDDRSSNTDTAPVPLFIKAPGQTTAEVDERVAQHVDVLPTVLDILGFDPERFDFDGVPLTEQHRDVWAARVPAVLTEDGLDEFAPVPAATESPTIPWITGLFPDPSDPYRVGTDATRVGTAPTTPEVSQEVTATLDQAELYDNVSLDAATIPANVTGVIEGGSVGSAVAVVVNGTIAGAGRSFHFEDHRFSVLVDPRYFVEGHNEIALLLLDDGDVLVPLT